MHVPDRHSGPAVRELSKLPHVWSSSMCLHQKQRKLYIRSLVPLVIVLSVSGFAADGPAAEPQRAVLALYGSRPDLPSNVIVDEIIRSTLERELGPRLDFYAEFLDIYSP